MARKKVSTAKKSKRTGNFKMIADRFDDRTFANMEVALERSLAHLGISRDTKRADKSLKKFWNVQRVATLP
jgi:hypothetical protein